MIRFPPVLLSYFIPGWFHCSFISLCVSLKQFNETPSAIQFREEETRFLFTRVCHALMVTLIARGRQIGPHIAGYLVLKYDVLKCSTVAGMSSFPYVLVWK